MAKALFSRRITGLIFFLFLLSQISYGKAINVGYHQPIKTLRSAIEIAANSDTIYLYTGVYKEGNIILTKSIVLIGKGDAVLDGEGKFEILTISANNFSIQGVTLQNSGYSSMNDFASIKIIDASKFKIEGNTIRNASFAIHISNCKDFTVANNTIRGIPREEQNTGNGIHLWKCTNATIQNNNVSGHRDGIYFEFVTHSKIKNNISTQNLRYGLHFMFSNNDTYSANNFMENGAGVAVMFSHDVDMIGNKFSNNQGGSAYGILLKEISDGHITGNSFTDNTVGIFMEGTNRIAVEKNIFKGNGWAFRIQSSCSDINVFENHFTSNTFDVSTNGSLMLNKFERNYWDKYEGYDLNKDGVGDVPYHPVSLYSIITERMPFSIMLFRSFMVMLLERIENAVPAIIPVDLKDDHPLIKPLLK